MPDKTEVTDDEIQRVVDAGRRWLQGSTLVFPTYENWRHASLDIAKNLLRVAEHLIVVNIRLSKGAMDAVMLAMSRAEPSTVAMLRRETAETVRRRCVQLAVMSQNPAEAIERASLDKLMSEDESS